MAILYYTKEKKLPHPRILSSLMGNEHGRRRIIQKRVIQNSKPSVHTDTSLMQYIKTHDRRFLIFLKK